MQALRVVLGASVYCLAFMAAWFHSLDQWYLPAGIRIGALLILPRRLWFVPLAGEVTAIFALNVPLISTRGLLWSLTSPFTTFSTVAISAFMCGIGIDLPVGAIPKLDSVVKFGAISTIASTVANIGGASLLIDGYWNHLDLGLSLVFSLGDYLGILMVAPAYLLWRDRATILGLKSLLKESGAAALALTVMAIILQWALQQNLATARVYSLAMMVPAIWLTVRHGWRGAAVGVVLVNVCIALSMRAPSAMGARDDTAMLLQGSLALLGTCLLCFGSLISHYYKLCSRYQEDTAEAMRLARTGYMQSEDHLRRVRVDIAHAARSTRSTRSPRLVAAAGYRVQLDPAVDERATLDSIFPIDIENFGLFAAVESPSFVEHLFKAGIKYKSRLLGPAHLLPESTQRMAYRIANDVVAHYRKLEPEFIHLTIRVSRAGRVKAAIIVQVGNATVECFDRRYLNDAKDRCKAFGAIIHERPERFSAMIYP